MIKAANFFSVNSSESDTDEERDKSVITVESMKKIKKKNRESKDSFAGKESEIAARDGEKLSEDAPVKKKSDKENVNSEPGNGVKESKKKNMEKKADSEVGDDGGKKSKKKKKKSKKVSVGDEIGNRESSKVNESTEGNPSDVKALVNTDDDDDAKRETGKRKRVVDSDLGAEESTREKSNKRKKPSVYSELEENSLSSAKKKSKAKKQSEDPAVDENNNDCTEDAGKKQSEAEGNSLKDPKKKRKKKMKQSEDPEAEENSQYSAKDAKRKQNADPEIEEHNKNSTEVAKKKRCMDSEAQGNDLNSTEDAKKKRKKKKKQSEDPEAEENNNGGTKDGKKKGKKQKGSKSDEVVATPSSKSTKKVKFSDQVEVFPTEDEESEEEEEGFPTELVRGKRFTKEEDELVRKAVLEYVENHALGDEGINMVMDCKSHPQLRGCWKEITAALPWRTHHGVYHRAHTLFEQGSKGIWTKEDLETVIKYQKKYGNDWRTLADAMGKHRKHVKDAWRRIRLASKKKGHWSMEEYQNLFDLVNKDLRMKAFQEKRTKHGMLRDNIPWMAISDQLGTRNHTFCCSKWYDQLSSPMVAKGIWANVDDYRLLDELTKLDAACVDDVDWDDLLGNRDGDACRQRWNQMVHHIGLPGTKTFAEQVEILSQRYCPDIAEDREDFDNRPYEDQSSPED